MTAPFPASYYAATANPAEAFPRLDGSVQADVCVVGATITGIAAILRPSIEATYPRLKGVPIDYEWFGQDGIIINRIPHLGRIGKNLFYAEGYSGHGIATSHIVAEIMAAAITGHMAEFDTFAQVRHIRLPFGQWIGQRALAAGMWYFTLREKLR